ncbi:MAG: 4-hydroxy-3-methylbut-2-enyl diphosphate reductase [Armatimonadetes bacterium]|nr:4-hydroxy-3-methylbut-2-enyl diphosphate reductase [Armatimonadota bacterium]
MKIVVAPHAGFCFGVRRAIEMARRAVAEGRPVYSLGPLIHNRQAVENLRCQGLTPVEGPAYVPEGARVMIRTHGAGRDIYQQLRTRGVEVIDATCPFVTRAHDAARRFHQEGYQVLVLGDREHPEAQGIVQQTDGAAVIVSRPEDIDGLELSPRVAVVCQTTQRRDNLLALVAAILPRVQELRVANTICDATTQRQQASAELAKAVDVMIVVGGYHSANTRRLAEICAAAGTRTHHVEVADELRPEWFVEAKVVGITAGASTPDDVLRAVAQRVLEIGGPGSEITGLADSPQEPKANGDN